MGKTSITKAIRERLDVTFSVSLTTRPLSHEDVDGEDYLFIGERDFKDQVKLGMFIEWAQVHDNFYGTPREPVDVALAQGETVMLEIDVQGAKQVKAAYPDAIGIFVEAPSDEDLLCRLRDRKREPEEVIQRRFARAQSEISEAHRLGIYDKTIINDNLASAIEQAVAFIKDSATSRNATA